MASGVATVRRSNLQVVIVVDMAGSAGNIRMSVSQEESGRRVIEFCVQPGIKSVARLASRREFRACVIRIRRLLIIPLMAGNALRREPLKLSDSRALVTFLALHCGVRAK